MLSTPLLASLCASFLCAPPLPAPPPLAPPPPTTASPALERGLSTIEVNELRSDLFFLASDEMRGRDTPSHEQRIAARFLAARLERLGWEPGTEDGYLYEFDLPLVAIDEGASALSAVGEGGFEEWQVGEDYAFHPAGLVDRVVEGDGVVYAGAPKDPDLLADLDLEGHWLFLEDAGLGYGEVMEKARKGGAAGVLLAPGPARDAQEMRERVSAWGSSVLEGRLKRERRGRGLPYLYLTSDAARELLRAAQVTAPERGALLEVSVVERRATVERAQAGLENVCGLWPGSDPALRDEVLILSAHYDHIGVNAAGQVNNGADDNGSGTTALLGVAEGLSAYGPMSRTVLIMWVCGEEKGLLGSAAWTRDPWLPEGMHAVAAINIDMIGRNAPDKLLITPTSEREEYNGLVRLAERLAPLEGFAELGSCDAYWKRSDHYNFAVNLDIPVTFLFSDLHEDYHQPTDTPDKVDCDKVRRVARLALRMLDGLQAPELDL